MLCIDVLVMHICCTQYCICIIVAFATAVDFTLYPIIQRTRTVEDRFGFIVIGFDGFIVQLRIALIALWIIL